MSELFEIIKALQESVLSVPILPMEESWHGRTSTLIVTDECNLRCTYCYCIKSPEKMTWKIAKEYIDALFEESRDFHLLPKDSQLEIDHRKIFEFIGGEPLLEAELMFKCMDYIVERVYLLDENHPWKRTDWPCPCGKNHDNGIRFMISTNGLLLNEEWIRKHLLSYPERFVYIGMTIDGTQEMHDLCRKTVDGRGSYDEVMKAWRWLSKHFKGCTNSTKSTIAHENIDYIFDIVKYFYDLGLTSLSQNCVFENVWHRGDQFRLFKQLVKTADFLIQKERYKKISVRWFSSAILTKSQDFFGKWCGAGTYMDACDWSGKVYPCLRFKQIKTREPYVMGSSCMGLRSSSCIDEFMEASKISPIHNPIQAKTTGIACATCPISSQCSDCQAFGYDCFGRLDVKTPFLCPMQKATAVANIYFFSHLLDVPVAEDYLEELLDDWTKNDYFSTDGEFKVL